MDLVAASFVTWSLPARVTVVDCCFLLFVSSPAGVTHVAKVSLVRAAVQCLLFCLVHFLLMFVLRRRVASAGLFGVLLVVADFV